MSLKKGVCKHFNGIQHDCCDAGLRYESFPALPCFRDHLERAGVKQGIVCEKFQEPTLAEVMVEKARNKKEVEKFLVAVAQGLSPCCNAPLDERAVITDGRHSGHGPRFCSKCKKTVFVV